MAAGAHEIVPPADHEDGWEYLYLASELARGLAAYQEAYAQYVSQMVEPSDEHVSDPAGHIRELTDQISAVVAGATQLLSPESLERALGCSGESGR